MRTVQFSLGVLACLFLSGAAVAAPANPDIPITVEGQQASIPVALSVGLGRSVPDTLEDVYVDRRGPSRRTGGEVITVRFREPKEISAIRLSAFSTSGTGKILMRGAVAQPDVKVKERVPIEELFKFDKATETTGEEHLGLLMLSPQDYVQSYPAQEIQEIQLVVEGYTNNDATLLIELTSPDGFAFEDFVVRRSGSSTGGPIGGYFDESAYPQFTPADRLALLTRGQTPALEQLAGTSWVCSNYAADNSKDIDFKTRQYFSTSPGLLQSTTDLNPDVSTWILTQEGWKLPAVQILSTSCGEFSMTLILRQTPEGNLISESVFSRTEFRRACMAFGYRPDQIENWLRQSTYPSAVNRGRYAVFSHEFCRPVQLP